MLCEGDAAGGLYAAMRRCDESFVSWRPRGRVDGVGSAFHARICEVVVGVLFVLPVLLSSCLFAVVRWLPTRLRSDRVIGWASQVAVAGPLPARAPVRMQAAGWARQPTTQSAAMPRRGAHRTSHTHSHTYTHTHTPRPLVQSHRNSTDAASSAYRHESTDPVFHANRTKIHILPTHPHPYLCFRITGNTTTLTTACSFRCRHAPTTRELTQ